MKNTKENLKRHIDDLIIKINDTIFKERFCEEKLKVEIIGIYNKDNVSEEQLLNIIKELEIFSKNGVSSRFIDEKKQGILTLCGQEYPIINWNTNEISYKIYGD